MEKVLCVLLILSVIVLFGCSKDSKDSMGSSITLTQEVRDTVFEDISSVANAVSVPVEDTKEIYILSDDILAKFIGRNTDIYISSPDDMKNSLEGSTDVYGTKVRVYIEKTGVIHLSYPEFMKTFKKSKLILVLWYSFETKEKSELMEKIKALGADDGLCQAIWANAWFTHLKVSIGEHQKDVMAKGVVAITNESPVPDLSGLEEIPNVTIHHTDGVVIPKWCFFAVANEPGWYCSLLSKGVTPNGEMDWKTKQLTLYKSLGRQDGGQAFREYLIKDSAKQVKYRRLAESYLKRECGWTPADFKIVF